MLKYISSDSLSGQEIQFSNGLNIVLGPDDGRNSIGKSSLLLLIDFAFGGGAFLDSDSNVPAHVGHFDLGFGFELSSGVEHFIRSTNEPNIIKQKIGRTWVEVSITKYKSLLKKFYGLGDSQPTFRQVVSPFSRIYGRKVDDANCPIAARPGDAKKNGVMLLLKMFDRFESISIFEEKIKKVEARASNLNSAFKTEFAQKLKKRELAEAEDDLKSIQVSIDSIKSSLDDNAFNYNNLLSEINLKRQEEIDEHVRYVLGMKSQLLRLDRNLVLSTKVSKRHFNRIHSFFPNVNIEKLEEIENFHGAVAGFLKQDIEEERKSIKTDISNSETLIENLRGKIRESTQSENSKSANQKLVDELLELHLKVTKLQGQINFNYASNNADLEKKDLSSSIEDTLNTQLSSIQSSINDALPAYIEKFYSKAHAVPKLTLSKGTYTFSHGTDTGTGKSDANMISLDLALLNSTKLPYLIHDTIVFKQIQASATENIIEAYSEQSKQVFISLDEITRFSRKAQSKILERAVIQLSHNSPAFKTIWSTQKETESLS
ncbi:DUF2326 domain-containing protein [Vibrio amylolyticus]|uniref:DUF2326 domain-containing protein n=1 Tax=Vibrio amylolyticus TaxID=2847292 RepID=UPI003553BC98